MGTFGRFFHGAAGIVLGIFAAVFLLVLGCGVFTAMLLPVAQTAADRSNDDKGKPPADLTTFSVERLVELYGENEVAADGQFKGKWFRVEGRLGRVHREPTGTPFASLDAGHPLYSVLCSFRPDCAEALGRLRAGDRVTIAGVGDGRQGMSLFVRNCSLCDETTSDARGETRRTD